MGRGTSGTVLAPATDGEREGADLSDRQLVAAVRRGEDRAFELLYERYHRRITAYAVGMVKDHGRAEDVTQEVFVSALRRMRETERPIAFKPWIYEIARNACIDAYRRSRRAEEVSLHADDVLAPADHRRLVGTDPTPDAAFAAKQQLEHLCGAFGGLSETHHEILVLRELEGLSYREIGDRMGMSRPAVESTLFRARRRLTQEYDDIVSGARCRRIQGVIATAADGALGARDARRLARHLAHCQPCRREAVRCGLDAGVLVLPPPRKRVAAKIAGLLPLPAFLRHRSGGGEESPADLASGGGSAMVMHLSGLSEQLACGWAKLLAAAALLLAGAGAGVGVSSHVGAPSARLHKPGARPVSGAAPHVASPAPSPRATTRLRTVGDLAGRRSKAAARRVGQPSKTSHVARRRHVRTRGPSGAPATGPGVSTPARRADGSGPTRRSPGTPQRSSSSQPTSGSSTPRVPSETDPVGGAVQDVTNAAQGVTQQPGGAVQGAANTVQGAAQQALGAANTVQGAAQQALGAANTVQGAAQQAAGAVDNAAGQAAGAGGDVVGGATG